MGTGKNILASLLAGAGGLSEGYQEGKDKNKEFIDKLSAMYMQQMMQQSDPHRQKQMQLMDAEIARMNKPSQWDYKKGILGEQRDFRETAAKAQQEELLKRRGGVESPFPYLSQEGKAESAFSAAQQEAEDTSPLSAMIKSSYERAKGVGRGERPISSLLGGAASDVAGGIQSGVGIKPVYGKRSAFGLPEEVKEKGLRLAELRGMKDSYEKPMENIERMGGFENYLQGIGSGVVDLQELPEDLTLIREPFETSYKYLDPAEKQQVDELLSQLIDPEIGGSIGADTREQILSLIYQALVQAQNPIQK
jgi:hypothetical protein